MSDSTLTPPAGEVPSVVPPEQARAALVAALQRPRYEVLPLTGTAEAVERHVPRHIPVTVTASPKKGIEPTLVLTERLAGLGFAVVPHLAARLVTDESHLAEVLDRLDGVGVRDAFVVGGDSKAPVGEFADALALLTAMRRLRGDSGPGHRLDQVGITGYPEGHPLVSDSQLGESLSGKQHLATYVVTQMCFDAKTVSAWVSQIRQSGVRLPVYVGVAGKIDRRKLMQVSARIGLGGSARFLRKHRHGWARLLLPGAYSPDRLIRGLVPDLAEPSHRVAGLHVYTLGAVAATERWRRQALDKLTGDGDR